MRINLVDTLRKDIAVASSIRSKRRRTRKMLRKLKIQHKQTRTLDSQNDDDYIAEFSSLSDSSVDSDILISSESISSSSPYSSLSDSSEDSDIIDISKERPHTMPPGTSFLDKEKSHRITPNTFFSADEPLIVGNDTLKAPFNFNSGENTKKVLSDSQLASLLQVDHSLPAGVQFDFEPGLDMDMDSDVLLSVDDHVLDTNIHARHVKKRLRQNQNHQNNKKLTKQKHGEYLVGESYGLQKLQSRKHGHKPLQDFEYALSILPKSITPLSGSVSGSVSAGNNSPKSDTATDNFTASTTATLRSNPQDIFSLCQKAINLLYVLDPSCNHNRSLNGFQPVYHNSKNDPNFSNTNTNPDVNLIDQISPFSPLRLPNLEKNSVKFV